MSARCGCQGCGSGDPCGCGSERGDPCATCCPSPDTETNPPGLDALAFGAARYGATLRRMRERLSGADLPALRGLTARRLDEAVDPALALLDGWACLSDIVGFYNERFVNEHYLRTCTERRSAVELARLVGYTPRPGVAAAIFLAFALDDVNKEAALEVPSGTRVYSQPGPGETMQPFETSEALTGRPRWSEMRPRLASPQRIDVATSQIFFKGISTGLRKGDTLLVELDGKRYRRTVAVVEPLAQEDRTRVALEEEPAPTVGAQEFQIKGRVLKNLVRPPAIFAASRDRAPLDPRRIFGARSYAAYGMLGATYPALAERLGVALGGTTPGGNTGAVTVSAMRIKAALHGHNAPLVPSFDEASGTVKHYAEWLADGSGANPTDVNGENGEEVGDGNGVNGGENGEGGENEGGGTVAGDRQAGRSLLDSSALNPLGDDELALDTVYDQIVPGSKVIIVRSGEQPRTDEGLAPFDVRGVRTESRVEFNMPARVTVLTLDRAWHDGAVGSTWGEFRDVVVYAQDEPLELAEKPLGHHDVRGSQIELDGYYGGLQPGRRVIVAGERADLRGISGVQAAELVMISNVKHALRSQLQPAGAAARQPATDATNDTLHTFISFAQPSLRYRYKRDTVKIYGNVAQATHGETRAEVLGGGDAARALQTFDLKQAPLTWIAAPTATGIASTLEVRVNDLRWHEAANPASIAKDDRKYVARTNDANVTSVTFGLGARPPTGRDNVRARYRIGIGAAGNVRAGQASVLASRPNGVMGVTNPLPAAGGVDRDGLDAIRRRAPIGLAALDRLVSAADIEDFARAFGGIGKARLISAGPGTNRYTLAIAGENDAPITTEVLRDALIAHGNLEEVPGTSGVRTLGVPAVTVDIQLRHALLIGIRARIRLKPDRLWEAVVVKLRDALDREFGFDAREMGQPAYPGRAMAVMQEVAGVAYVDLVAFDVIDTGTVDAPRPPEEIAGAALALFDVDPAAAAGLPNPPRIEANQLAYLSPAAPATLLLTPIEEVP